MDPHPTPARTPGRPRGFEPQAALEAAMKRFWADGFEGTSIDVLARETGMPRATIYQLYGDKQGLFLAAVTHYAETRSARIGAALGPFGDLHADLARFFDAVIDLALSEPLAKGCLISCVLADAAGANARFRDELDRRCHALEARIAERLALSGLAHPEPRAQVIAAIARGMMVRARAGTERAALAQTAAEALALLAPDSGP